MALFGSRDKHPGYNPVTVSDMIKADTKKEKILNLIKRYKKAEKGEAVRLYKKIKLLLAVL